MISQNTVWANIHLMIPKLRLVFKLLILTGQLVIHLSSNILGIYLFSFKEIAIYLKFTHTSNGIIFIIGLAQAHFVRSSSTHTRSISSCTVVE